MREFAWPAWNHEDGILAWFDLPINNGTVEALNNVAKSLSHQAKGYGSPITFATLLMHCMEKSARPIEHTNSRDGSIL